MIIFGTTLNVKQKRQNDGTDNKRGNGESSVTGGGNDETAFVCGRANSRANVFKRGRTNKDSGETDIRNEAESTRARYVGSVRAPREVAECE